MVDKRTILNLIPGQEYELRTDRGMRISYPQGKTSPKVIVARDLGTWMEPPPPVVTPPPVVEPPVEPPTTALRTFYLSPSGSDSAAGSQIAPWRTLSKFYGQCRAGDLLLVRGGTYSGQAIDVSGKVGTAADPITVKAYQGEKPSFPGSEAFAYFDGASAYHVLDGLTIPRVVNGASTVIWIGNGKSTPGSTNTHHITIRNCDISKTVGSTRTTAHGIYLSHMCSDVLIEDNVIKGLVATDDRAAAVHWFHAPSATKTIVRRNILREWARGILLWDEATPATITAEITHNTLQGNTRHMDVRYHSTLLIRNNVGSAGSEAGTVGDLYDPNHSALTTADHNYWDQTLTPAGGLTSGSPAINGAHDGSDAGAVPYP